MRSSKFSLFMIALVTNTVLAFTTKAFAHSIPKKSMVQRSIQDFRCGSSKLRPFARRKSALTRKEMAIGTRHRVAPNTDQEISLSKTPSSSLVPQSTWRQIVEKFFGMDNLASMTYLCNFIALSLPIILVPIAATEYAAALGLGASSVTSMVASLSSLASVGGAAGKFVNGFVCHELGTYATSKWYLVAVAVCSLAFSLSTSPFTMGLAYAFIEFFASVQCASLAVMLTDYYKGNADKLTLALTSLGLSATIGEILAKILGSTLSNLLHWRQVARVGSVVAILGALAISRAPGRRESRQLQKTKKPFHISSVVDSLKAVLGSGLFWKIALAYSMTFVASCTDRILGPFYHSVTGLPHNICGSLTLSVTLGLILGLATASNKITNMQTLQEKKAFFTQRYAKSVAATLGLTATAYFGPALISSKFILASLVAFLTSTMAWNIAFQTYQFPAMIGRKFGGHEAVCISFLDGFGYLFSVPIFAALGVLVPSRGWASGWGMLTILFAGAGVVMLKNLTPILDSSHDPSDKKET